MIVLFTANIKGGVIQLNMQLLKELTELGEEVRCFVPEDAVYSISDELRKKIIHYKSIVKNIELLGSKIGAVTAQIRSCNPNIVWFTDQMPCSMAVGRRVARFCRTISTIHDVNYHPTDNNRFKAKLYREFQDYLKVAFDKKTTYRVLLSSISREKYLSEHKGVEKSTFLLPLGAHVPDVIPRMPSEMSGLHAKSYILFIGRIDRYKGISTLQQIYRKYEDITVPLVVAGAGNLTETESLYFKNDRRVVLINRYIEDSEFVALVQSAFAVILPYIEASQSGVIPIAYKFGVPVITSNVEGLTQFVNQGTTGFVCKNFDEYRQSIEKLQNVDGQEIKNACKKYYENQLEWKHNLLMLKREIQW